MSNTFKLVSREDPEKFGYFMDWDFDDNGHIIKVTGTEKLVQEVMKITMVERLDWGYGTVIHGLIGEKGDDQLTMGVIARSVIESLSLLRQLQMASSVRIPMTGNEVIAQAIAVQSRQVSETGYYLNVRVVTEAGQMQEISETVNF